MADLDLAANAVGVRARAEASDGRHLCPAPLRGTLLGDGSFNRVLASVHSVKIGPVTAEISQLLADGDPATAMRVYLAEAAALVSQFDAYDVLAHRSCSAVLIGMPDVHPSAGRRSPGS